MTKVTLFMECGGLEWRTYYFELGLSLAKFMKKMNEMCFISRTSFFSYKIIRTRPLVMDLNRFACTFHEK